MPALQLLVPLAVSLASPSNTSSLHCNRTLSFAHCIVGRPRTFVNRCVQQSIVTNVLKAMPGTSTSFLCLRLPSNATQWNEKADYSLSSELESVRNAAERFRLMTNVAAVKIEGDEPVPADLRADIMRDDELAQRFQMWRNIQGCFDLVLRHERAVGQKFSFITRLRPDAVFFDRWALPPFLCQLKSMLIPKGGLGCKTCSNDHLALLPRDISSKYFHDIFADYTRCENGTCARIHREGYRRKHSRWVIQTPQGGAGYVYHAVGLDFVTSHIPYALSSKRPGDMAMNMGLECQRLLMYSDFQHRVPYERQVTDLCEAAIQKSSPTVKSMLHKCSKWNGSDY